MAEDVRLTPRQREVVPLLVRGRTYAQVGEELGISERTVEKHVSDIADQIDGDGTPRTKVVEWAWSALRGLPDSGSFRLM